MESKKNSSLSTWGALAGVAAAIFDTALLGWIGLEFSWGGHDATLANGAFLAANYAAIGFLLGWMVEARRRERESARLLRESAESIAEMRARLAESEKRSAIGELSMAVAHEVRNPLAVIRSAAQSLGETAAGDEEKEACAFIVTEIDRLSNVVTSLLALARPLMLDRRAVEVGDVLERARLLASEALRRSGVSLAVRKPAGLPLLDADPDLLCQVALGLVVNASEASPPGGEIVLDASLTDGGSVEVAVSDRGAGVPAELRERVFEPFFTTRASGVGLGLAIAKRIVEAHGGKIGVGSNASAAGARFWFQVPSASPAQQVA